MKHYSVEPYSTGQLQTQQTIPARHSFASGMPNAQASFDARGMVMGMTCVCVRACVCMCMCMCKYMLARAWVCHLLLGFDAVCFLRSLFDCWEEPGLCRRQESPGGSMTTSLAEQWHAGPASKQHTHRLDQVDKLARVWIVVCDIERVLGKEHDIKHHPSRPYCTAPQNPRLTACHRQCTAWWLDRTPSCLHADWEAYKGCRAC